MTTAEMFKTLELQQSLIEAQSFIIGELMRLYSTEADFHLSDELEENIEAVKRMKAKLTAV